jgi:hypothetical protein
VVDVGGGPNHDRLGFRYWNHPGAFNSYLVGGNTGRFLAFWSSLISAAFSYGNIQVVALSGTETKNPRRIIPSATKKTFYRVFFFYVLSIFIVGLIVYVFLVSRCFWSMQANYIAVLMIATPCKPRLVPPLNPLMSSPFKRRVFQSFPVSSMQWSAPQPSVLPLPVSSWHLELCTVSQPKVMPPRSFFNATASELLSGQLPSVCYQVRWSTWWLTIMRASFLGGSSTSLLWQG